MTFICQLCQQDNEEGDAGSKHQQQQAQAQFSNMEELEAHLASEHFNCLPYECEQCQFAKFPTEFAVMKHNEMDHGNRMYSFRCRITPDIKKKRAQVHDYLLLVAAAGDEQCQTHQQQQTAHLNTSAGVENGEKSGANDNQAHVFIKSELLDDGGHQTQMKRISAAVDDEVPSVEIETANDDMDGANAGLENAAAALLEHIQAACSQQNGRIATSAGWRKSAGSSFGIGDTMETRGGAELLMGSSTAGNGMANGELVEGRGARDVERQLRRQEADIQEILKAAAAVASQVNGGNNTNQQPQAQGQRSPYSLRNRPSRFSSYPFLQRQQQNWQQQHGTVKQCGQTVAAAVNKGGGGLVKKNTLGYGAGLANRRTTNSKLIERIPCRQCNELVNSTGGCLMHHVNTRHLRLPLFQCRNCKKDFFEVSNTRIHKHMRIHHGGDTSNLISNYAKYSHDLHAGRDDCFGTREERLRASRGETSSPQRQSIRLPHKGTAAGGETKRMSGGNDASGNNINNSSSASQTCATIRAVLQSQKHQTGVSKPVGDTSNLFSVPFKNAKDEHDGEDMLEEDEEVDALGEPEEFQKHFVGANDQDDDMEMQDQHEEEAEDNQGEQEEVEEEEEGDAPPAADQLYQNLAFISKWSDRNNSGSAQEHPGISHRESCSSSMAATSSNSRRSQQQQLMTQMQLGDEEKVACKMCGELVLNKMLNRLNHVNVRHLHLPLHQCRLCNKSFPSYSRSACYSHVQFAHRADLESGQFSQNIEEHIIYMKEQYSDQLTEAATEYFD